jgi:hypothetical protein
MPTETLKIASYADLLSLLNRDGVMHQADAESKSVRIPTKQPDKGIEGVQLIRWQDEDGVLQFIQSIPVNVSAENIAPLEAALAHLNHALPWPGLDLNHEYRLLAYRLALPILPRGSLEPMEIQSVFSLAVKTAADLTPTLRRIAAGELAPDGAVADVQRELAPPPAAKKPEPPPAAPSSTIFRVD